MVEKLSIQLVEVILETLYSIFNYVVTTPSHNTKLQETNVGHFKLWRFVGVHINNVTSYYRTEIEHYMKLPPTTTNKDPLQWWLGISHLCLTCLS